MVAFRNRAAVLAALARESATKRVNPWTIGVPGAWAALIASTDSRLVCEALRQLARAGDIPLPVLELGLQDVGEFIPGRRFRADIAWLEHRVYVEVDGGTFMHGKHARGSGIASDCEKYSLASGLGWRVVRIDASWVHSGILPTWVRAALAWRPVS